MSGGVIDPVEQALAADASLHDVLELVDAAIESATATGDGVTLDRLASLLDGITTERGQDWSGLSIAAARARALAGRAAATGTAPPTVVPVDAPTATVPPPPTATADEKARYAGWWLRTVALFLDLVVLVVLYVIVGRASGGGDVGSNLLGFEGVVAIHPNLPLDQSGSAGAAHAARAAEGCIRSGA